jgi:fructose-bisphosphate aldolase class I
MILKPSMVISGKDCPEQASVQEVATFTVRCLLRNVPALVGEYSSDMEKQLVAV